MTTKTFAPLWNVYVRKDNTFVPNVARTEAGYFLDIEPVRVMPTNDIEALASAIEQVMASGNSVIPTPKRSEFPRPVVLKPARVKTWKALERVGACFTISSTGADAFEIWETGRDSKGEWLDMPSLNKTLPHGSTPLDIASEITDRINRRTDLN